jgi:hypothetical protein
LDVVGQEQPNVARQSSWFSGGEAMNVNIGAISPAPTEEEAAAIAAAITMMWPQPVALSTTAHTNANVSWRFSGRWWASNHISRRSRPGA